MAVSTPAYAADIELPILEPVPMEITIPTELPDPVEVEETKPLPALPAYKPEACNCYNILRENFSSLLPMATLLSTAQPYNEASNVAIFKYPATKNWPNGIPHVAIVHGELPDGSIQIEEYNYHSCTHSFRTISPSDHNLVGFYTL